MNGRRGFLTAAGALAVTSLGAYASQSTGPGRPTGNAQSCTAFDKARQAGTTPDAALALLKEGNVRFANGTSINCDLRAQVKATAGGQAPFAAVVGCIDSRVPPELVFDQKIGDIFAARIAGNFVNTDIIGSLEFATKLSGARLIVVLGHTECGAIKGAVDDAKRAARSGRGRKAEDRLRDARRGHRPHRVVCLNPAAYAFSSGQHARPPQEQSPCLSMIFRTPNT